MEVVVPVLTGPGGQTYTTVYDRSKTWQLYLIVSLRDDARFCCPVVAREETEAYQIFKTHYQDARVEDIDHVPLEEMGYFLLARK